jgi:hypothetical protein
VISIGVTIVDSSSSRIGNSFSNCSGLTSITVDYRNTNYHSDGNCLIKTSSKELILGCKNSIIPTDGSVTSIGDCAFSGCSGLTSITIPDRVTSIGWYAFKDCNSLVSINIPNSVTSIGWSAFAYCSSLTSITIPSSITYIGDRAFFGCDSLTSAIFENTNYWWYSSSYNDTSGTSISSTDLKNAKTAAEYLTDTYCEYYWKRS